ncbi:hypothetical protein [Polyangium aurulentum]|uniref:hypothetical protein n=1 Tax=Polyangium aurulentum TaxID=2567896 RepID=UPI00197FEE0B|nr:hypothetical protein [Polyangium aurulentum]UQA58158.1 hypothetical protein E8A73_044050 [Polyangium aurulentum]
MRSSPLALCLALAALAAPLSASAQIGVGQPSPGNVAPGGQPPPDQPQTHAASGGDEAPQLQTQEPTLPSDPLAVPPEIRKQIGTSGTEGPNVPQDEPVDRRFYGLWYSEKSPSYQFRTLFPLWAEHKKGNDRSSLFGLFYYNRRSPKADADVLFPLFWRLRNGNSHTTAVGPFIHQESEATAKKPATHSNWLPPLLFEGRSGKSGYLHIPPLLTFTRHSDHDGLNIVGPMFCRWKGGPDCDTRTAEDIDLGLAPVYFYGRNERTEYEIIPPLLHYYRYNEIGGSYLNVWGPYIRSHDQESDSQHVFPFYWHKWGKNEDYLTLFPFFHYGYSGTSSRLVTPLFVWARGENGEKTFATWGYAHYKGRTELEMITPLYWHYQDPDIGLDRKLLFPFLWKSDSPRGKELAIFPFYGRFQRYGLSDETWVTPLFRYKTDTTGWAANLFPFIHVGRSYESQHLVIAPFVWDFASPTSRATVVLPGFFRFADEEGVSQLALNTYYHEKRVAGGREWEFHFFPFFSYGQSPVGHWWNVLYGLAGYTREGTMARMRLAYIPITLSK